jgi:hypothetical protein
MSLIDFRAARHVPTTISGGRLHDRRDRRTLRPAQQRDAVQTEIARGATEEQAVATIRFPQYEKMDGYDSQRATAVRQLYRQLTGALK